MSTTSTITREPVSTIVDNVLILGRDPLGPFATEEDFEAWVAYVKVRVAIFSQLRIRVDVRSVNEANQRNLIVCLASLNELVIHDALQRIHHQWMALGAPRAELEDVDDDDLYEKPTIPSIKAPAA
jgi:hypothetical protein